MIPIKYLSSVNFNAQYFKSNLCKDEFKKFVKEWSSSKKFTFKTNFCSLNNFKYYASNLPKSWEYLFDSSFDDSTYYQYSKFLRLEDKNYLQSKDKKILN